MLKASALAILLAATPVYAQSVTLKVIPPPPDVKSPPPDAMRTPSGLAYKVLKEGVGGRHPKPSSTVTVNYTGWTPDGKSFDSSVLSGKPATFEVEGVIAGWTEALQLMVEG